MSDVEKVARIVCRARCAEAGDGPCYEVPGVECTFECPSGCGSVARASLSALGGWDDERAWLIEMKASSPSSPQYWAGSSLFTSDHMDAIRFSRKVDAERAAVMMLDGLHVRICEHIWSAQPRKVGE